MLSELGVYLTGSFGDAQRIDYGTGHELNFMCFLYALHAVGVFATTDFAALVNKAHTGHFLFFEHPILYVLRLCGDVQILAGFVRYLRVVRRLQTLYYLEPAGSRGVWGLDDYHFMPFLLGSAQLMNHKHIRPRSVRSTEVCVSPAFALAFVVSVFCT